MKKRNLLILALASFSLFGCTGVHVHSYGEWKTSKVATCKEAGEEKRSCECGEVETRVVEKTAHIEEIDQGVEATCLVCGKTEGKHCSVCKEVIVAQTDIAPLGHEEVVDEKKEPTCLEAGHEEGKHCSRCGEVLEGKEPIEKLEHAFTNYEEKVVSSKTKEGEWVAKCDNGNCGQTDTLLQIKTPSMIFADGVLSWNAVENAIGYKLYNGTELVKDLGDVLSYSVLGENGTFNYSLEAYTDEVGYLENSKKSKLVEVNIEKSASYQDVMRTDFEGFKANKPLINRGPDGWEQGFGNFGVGKVEVIADVDNVYGKLHPQLNEEASTITKGCNVAILKAGTYRFEVDVKVGYEVDGTLSFGIFNGTEWLPSESKTALDLSNIDAGEWVTVSSTYTFTEDKTGFANLDLEYKAGRASLNNYVLIDNFRFIDVSTGLNVDVGVHNDFEGFRISLDGLLSQPNVWAKDYVGDIVYIEDKLENEILKEDDNHVLKAYTSNTDHSKFTLPVHRDVANAGIYQISIKAKLGSGATWVDNIGFRLSSNNPLGTVDMVFEGLDTLSSEEWVTLTQTFVISQDVNVDFINADFWVFTHNDVINSVDNYVLIDEMNISKITYTEL